MRSDLTKIGIVTILLLILCFTVVRIAYVENWRRNTAETRKQTSLRIGMSASDVSRIQEPDVVCAGGAVFETAAHDFDPSTSKAQISNLELRTVKRFIYFGCVIRVAEMEQIRRTCTALPGAVLVGFDKTDHVLWFNARVGSTYVVTGAS